MDFFLRIARGMCACAWEPNTTVERYNTMMTTISVKGYDENKQGIEGEGRFTFAAIVTTNRFVLIAFFGL